MGFSGLAGRRSLDVALDTFFHSLVLIEWGGGGWGVGVRGG